MRAVAFILATWLAACTDEPAEPEWCPEPGPPRDGCYPTYGSLTVRWSFETLSGDSKAPCLPGSPDVTVTISKAQLAAASFPMLPCAAGEALVSPQTHELYGIFVKSVADHEYAGGYALHGSWTEDPPTVVIYTDAGTVAVRLLLRDVMGADSTCEQIGFVKIRVFLDGALMREDDCAAFTSDRVYFSRLERVPVGAHTVHAEALDYLSHVIATSPPSNVTVLGGAAVATEQVLQP